MKKTYPNLTIISPSNALLNAFKKHFFFIFAFFALSVQSYAQGTTCAGATSLTVNGACSTGVTPSGTDSAPNFTSCGLGTSVTNVGWYTFNVTGGPLSITVTATANRNLAFQLFSSTSSCTGLVEIACVNAQAAGNNTETTTQLLPNGTYYVKVLNTNTNSMTLASLCVTSAPINDICSGAISLTSNTSCTTTSGSTIGATDNNETGDCTNGTEKAVWYSFVAVATSHTVTVDGVAGFDAVLGVNSACGSTTTPTGGGCVDATGDDGLETRTLTGLTIGNTYYIQVYDYYGVNMANGFTICVTHVAACTTPTAQPTALSLTPALTTITGSFTAASPAPNSYLVVVSASATPPTLTNGTTYTIGGTVGTGYTVVDTDSNTTFTATGLLSSTLYYVYVFSYNNLCSGGPRYLTTSPLTGSTTTLSPTYCSPTSQGPQRVYIDDIRFMGTLNDVDNLGSGYGTGYQNWTARPKAIQAQGEGINVFYRNVSYAGGAHVKAWVDWNKNGTFNTGELVYDTGLTTTDTATFGFIIPPATTPGDYRIRIRNNVLFDYFFFDYFIYDFTACENFNYTFWEYYDGEAEDYLFTVIASCDANIVTVTDSQNCGPGTVNLAVTATAGTTGFKWYSSETGATLITSTASGSWTTPSLAATTVYWVTATNGTCESLKRTKIIAEISPLPTVLFTPSAPIICGDNDVLQLTAGGDVEPAILINEKFEGGGLGVFKNVNNTPNGAPYDAITVWQNKTSPYIPTNTQVWSPAISSGLSGNKFAMSTSDVNPPGTVQQFLELTTAVNATNVTGLTLTFDMYYSRFGDQVKVQANNGTGWTDVQSYTASVGIGTRFAAQTINFTAYNNAPSLKIRIQFLSNWGDGVAVDNIRLFGIKTLNTAFNYDTSVVEAFTNVACTPPFAYVSGTPATTIWIKPTALQLENPSFSIPVTATLSNGCSASGTVMITNNTRTWQGITTDWTNTANWKPNVVPTIDNCIIIPSNTVISGTNYNAYGKNLIVRNSGNLNIQSSNNLTIADGIIVEPTGTFQIENNSNLVQINNVVNTGNIIYKRIAPNIKGSDYVYWSSPVFNQALGSIYTTPTQGPKYEWNTLINNGNGTGGNTSHGNWVSPTATMATGKGYIVRGSSSFGMAATNINSTFTGRPNNGNIPVTIYRGSYIGGGYTGANSIPINNLDDNYNLIGNPYPSAINALKFISDNSAVIEGNVKLWTHGTDPAANGGTITNPFYGTFANNYSADDYITLNNSGPSKAGYSLNIKSGQGFFVEMLDGAQGSGSVTFNNTQRRDNLGIPYANDAFYKNSNQQYTNLDDLERHRIWLDIKNAANTSEVTLVGYIEGATINKESSYDAIASTLTMGIYSFINGESFVIQGRGLPFDDNDQVAIGFNVPTAGTYSIGINTADGLFLGNQDIYLKDELLNVYHDLKTVPYSFTATTGIHDDRFKLVYKNTVLSNETFSTNEIQIAKNNNIIEIVSGNEIMDNVKVYDVRGRLIIEKSKINNNSISIDMVGIQDQVLIVNIVTAEGIKVTRKIL